MEDLEIQERLLYLGKKLEKNFEKHSGDEISAWMAHYIAEKMTAIEVTNGKLKSSAQRECFEAILTLWDYQRCFPSHVRPFKDFEPIFRALEHIDPNKTTPSFFRNENGDSQPPEEIEQAIKFITSLDAATRIMISLFVRESILYTTDKSTLEWLSAIKGIDETDEARVILELLPELDDDDTVQDQNAKRKKELTEYIERLEAFEDVSREVKSVLKAELQKMEPEL